ncbi:uncharacterized protein TNCV_3246371 [Trichonephila clavipes]|nr:uncharacterized protein TNCV_3246371 [Trichonephila clavipes]
MVLLPHSFARSPDSLGKQLNEFGFLISAIPLRHGGTLNSRRAASPLEWLVEREERWEASDQSQSVLPLNWGRTEPNSITCIVLKATANDRRHLTLCHDEFHGPRSGLC